MASETEKWALKTAKEGQSFVWKYFEIELPNKKRVKCTKCPSKYFAFSGSTRIMLFHLEKEHKITKDVALGLSQTERQRLSQIESETTKKTNPSSAGLRVQQFSTNTSTGLSRAQEHVMPEDDLSSTMCSPPAANPSGILKQESIVDCFSRYGIQLNNEIH